jgi:cyclopropane-fatty-acyl-phospholipid synthase
MEVTDMLQNHILELVQQRLQREKLPVSIKLWNEQVLSGGDQSQVMLYLSSPETLELLARPSFGKLAESYIKQKIDVQGTPRDVIGAVTVLFRNNKDGKKTRSLSQGWRLWRHSRRRDSAAIQSHYDVSDAFYGLWLDRQRVYSCAYFKTPDDDLELAQEQKLDHICRKLCLQPRERLLDIGCGWGALIMRAAERYKVHAVGITLSKHQFEYVNQKIKERGLVDRCNVYLMDYRDVPEEQPFDKIVSVGMFEHVGVRKLPQYFAKIHSLLKPGGIVMNHGITSSTFDNETMSDGGRDFIDRYVFPEGELTHVSKVMELMSRQGLESLDIENLRPHYAKTLWHWVGRLDANQDQACKLVGEEKYRIWRAYMMGFAYAFEQGWVALHQILAAKPLDDGSVPYPLTRDHMYC